MAVGVARLGGNAGFVGKFGQDPFGRFLLQTLAENRVDTAGTVVTGEAKTGLAFVTLKENGEREFIFYREPCADILLAKEEIHSGYIQETRILHFGTVSLIAEPSRSATYHAVKLAREAGKTVSLDVNLREALWPSLDQARQEMMQALQWAHLVKVSEEELNFLVGPGVSLEDGATALLNLGPDLILVTLGAGGCYYKTKQSGRTIQGISITPVDTTGAGDAFTAAMLTRLVDWGLDHPRQVASLSPATLEEFCFFANIAGALTCTKNGAISALPLRTEVEIRMG